MTPFPSTNPAPITLQHPRPTLVSMIAGALAQAATPSLVLEVPGQPPEQLLPLATDLPGRLAGVPVGTRLTTPDGCTVLLTTDGCTISNPGRAMVQAVARISR